VLAFSSKLVGLPDMRIDNGQAGWLTCNKYFEFYVTVWTGVGTIAEVVIVFRCSYYAEVREKSSG
jgi:hypothetical protein